MIPYSILDYIPKIHHLKKDAKFNALVNKIDAHLISLANEIKELYYLKDPIRCPSSLLEELAYHVNASIKNSDSELTKRKKIASAVQGHKYKSTWTKDIKIKLDTITGYDARVISITDSDDSIEMAQQANDPDVYWSTESAYDGSDDNLGTFEVGSMTEYVVAGNVYIDCHYGIHTAVLTADQIEQIINEIKLDNVSAYMVFYLSYINAIGQIIVYSGGII
jgi:hypothetical protein